MTGPARLRGAGVPGDEPEALDLSIVVIAHNEAQRIGACLDALAAQVTSRRFEVVVVDDGSTDGTRDVVASRDDGGSVRCVRLSPRRGRGIARRTGVTEARGRDVGFVDADIVVPTTWVERLCTALPGAAAVSGVAVPDGDVAVVARLFAATPRVVPGSATITGNNVILDGAVLRTVPFPETRLGEDFRLAELLRSAGHRLRSLPDVVVRHDERKSYGAALRWLYDSGVDATALLVEFRRVRLPDVVAASWAAVGVTSLLLAAVGTRWLLLVPVLATVVVAVVHVGSRFRLVPRPSRWVATAVADVPLMAAYLVGRCVGAWRVLAHRDRVAPAG